VVGDEIDGGVRGSGVVVHARQYGSAMAAVCDQSSL
jgi:hypothetical protein